MKDEYGNEIEYDPNDWVGEDQVDNQFIDYNNVSEHGINKSLNNAFGYLNLSLDNLLNIDKNEKASLLVSIIDNEFHIKDLYLYSDNDFKGQFKLPVGKYNVVLCKNMATNDDYNISFNEFYIIEDEYTNLLISEEKYVEKNEAIEETKIVSDTEIKDDCSSYLSFLLKAFIIIIILFLVLIVLKKKFEK